MAPNPSASAFGLLPGRPLMPQAALKPLAQAHARARESEDERVREVIVRLLGGVHDRSLGRHEETAGLKLCGGRRRRDPGGAVAVVANYY